MAKLVDKLTEESFKEIWSEERSSVRNSINDRLANFSQSSTDNLWWARREQLRLNKEVYATTDQLTFLNDRFACFAHISKEDKKFVAYTPDAVFGAADRQLKTTPGKLFARYFPLYTEKKLLEMAEAHIAEADLTVTWFEGTEIAKMYDKFGSVGACMSSKNWREGYHPALAYATPGVRLATVMAGEKVVARTLVVEQDGKKVYIRGYGQTSLIKYLQAEGYRPGDWQGVKFNTIVKEETGESGETKHVVFPYLDSNGGMASTTGSRTVMIDGVVMCPTVKQYEMLSRLSLTEYIKGASSSGTQTYLNLSSDKFTVTDFITGEKIDMMFCTDEMVSVQTAAGIGKAKKVNVPESYTLLNGNYVNPELLIKIGYTWYFNTPEALREAGLRKLDPAFYPEQADVWYTKYEVIDSGDLSYLPKDVVCVVTADDKLTYTHSSTLDKTYVRLHGTKENMGEDLKIFAHKDSSWKKTNTGRKVHNVTHEIVEIWDGEIEFARGKVCMSVLGESIWYRKRSEFAAIAGSAKLQAAIESYVGSAPTLLRMFKELSETVSGRSSNTAHRLIYGYGNSYDTSTVESMCRRIESLSLADAKVIAVEAYGNNGEVVQGVSRQAAYIWLQRKFAEMEAVEAPHYLYPAVLPEATIEILPVVDASVEPAPTVRLDIPTPLTITEASMA